MRSDAKPIPTRRAKEISKWTKIGMYESLVLVVLLYNSETWTPKPQRELTVVFEMSCRIKIEEPQKRQKEHSYQRAYTNLELIQMRRNVSKSNGSVRLVRYRGENEISKTTKYVLFSLFSNSMKVVTMGMLWKTYIAYNNNNNNNNNNTQSYIACLTNIVQTCITKVVESTLK